MFEPIEHRKTYELVAESLLARIAQRRLRPGDVLPTEREMTESFGVGRSSVREALRMLESKGVIEPGANGAFVVCEVGNALNRSLELLLSLEHVNLRELFEVRRILEGETAALAASRRSEAHLAELQAAISEMDAGLASENEDTFALADVRFHLTVAEATGNRIAVHMMLAVRDVLRRALRSIFHIPGSAARSQTHHVAIMQAIAHGDADEARAAMIEHLARVEEDIQDIALQSSFAPAVGSRVTEENA